MVKKRHIDLCPGNAKGRRKLIRHLPWSRYAYAPGSVNRPCRMLDTGFFDTPKNFFNIVATQTGRLDSTKENKANVPKSGLSLGDFIRAIAMPEFDIDSAFASGARIHENIERQLQAHNERNLAFEKTLESMEARGLIERLASSSDGRTAVIMCGRSRSRSLGELIAPDLGDEEDEDE